MAINVISQGYRHSLTTSLKRFCERHSCISILPIWSVYSSIYKNLGEYAYLLLRWSDVRSDRPRSSRRAGRPVGRGAGDERGAGGWPDLSRCNVSHVWRIKNVTSVISRAPARQRRTHLGPWLDGGSRISGPGSTASDASPCKTKAPPPELNPTGAR